MGFFPCFFSKNLNMNGLSQVKEDECVIVNHEKNDTAS